MSVRIKGHEYVTLSELADSFGVSPATIYIWVNRKLIKPFIYSFTNDVRERLVRQGHMSKEDADSTISHHAMLFDVDTKKPEVKKGPANKMRIVDGCAYYTSSDLSRLWGISQATISRWIKKERLKPALSLPINGGRKRHLFHKDTEKPIYYPDEITKLAPYYAEGLRAALEEKGE